MRAAVRGKAVVIHCAGLIEAADVDVELLREVNVEGTRHVLEACLEEDVKALVYTSSGALHGVQQGAERGGAPHHVRCAHGINL